MAGAHGEIVGIGSGETAKRIVTDIGIDFETAEAAHPEAIALVKPLEFFTGRIGNDYFDIFKFIKRIVTNDVNTVVLALIIEYPDFSHLFAAISALVGDGLADGVKHDISILLKDATYHGRIGQGGILRCSRHGQNAATDDSKKAETGGE